jgi:hypothetical protein
MVWINDRIFLYHSSVEKTSNIFFWVFEYLLEKMNQTSHIQDTPNIFMCKKNNVPVFTLLVESFWLVRGGMLGFGIVWT